MRFTIRPNVQHPDWPLKPDPDDLAMALRQATGKKESVAVTQAKALAMTQARVAAKARRGSGGMTDNLDWLAMIAKLRQLPRRSNPRTIIWIDGECPHLTHTINVCCHFRHKPPCPYIYVTFEVCSE